jgi:hypothetical protein
MRALQGGHGLPPGLLGQPFRGWHPVVRGGTWKGGAEIVGYGLGHACALLFLPTLSLYSAYGGTEGRRIAARQA